MPRSFLVFIFLVLSTSAVLHLSGCRNTNALQSDKLGFKDEKSMREVLKGTWILKEYEDSIDAGLSPKLLEYMLSKYNMIECDFDSGNYLILGYTPPMGHYYMDPLLDTCKIRFAAARSKMIFEIKYFDVQQRSVSIDTSEFIFDGDDTIMRVYKDSSHFDFVKYNMNKCNRADEYGHLINSKFIADKYYRADDINKRHHIIFTRCGNIEGAENIDPFERGLSTYSVMWSGFQTNPDLISFYSEDLKKTDLLSWRVSVDSLILTHYCSTDTVPIILVRDR